VPVSDYTPSVASVAAYIRARTKTRGGAEAGTFNPAAAAETDKTRPTAEGATEEINNALEDVSSIVGEDVAVEHRALAKRVVALRGAMLIELSYFTEQVNSGRSSYPQLKELYDEQWENLLTALGISTDAGGGAVPIGAGYPSSGGFPSTAIGMEQPF
jgi:hypothetical protein